MALSLLRGLQQVQRCLAAPALGRLLPQLWRLSEQHPVTAAPLTSTISYHTARVLQQSCITEDSERRALANRLLYRSRQRGFLELDLLVGLWAEKNIPTMSVQQLNELAVLLDQENPDLFKWLTGQLPPSDEMQRNSAYLSLREHVKAMMDENSHEAAQAVAGKEWVRGWDDWKKEGPAPGPAVASAAGSS